jgi:hypothetical protein
MYFLRIRNVVLVAIVNGFLFAFLLRANQHSLATDYNPNKFRLYHLGTCMICGFILGLSISERRKLLCGIASAALCGFISIFYSTINWRTPLLTVGAVLSVGIAVYLISRSENNPSNSLLKSISFAFLSTFVSICASVFAFLYHLNL